MTIIYPADFLPGDFKKNRLARQNSSAGIAGVGFRCFIAQISRITLDGMVK